MRQNLDDYGISAGRIFLFSKRGYVPVKVDICSPVAILDPFWRCSSNPKNNNNTNKYIVYYNLMLVVHEGTSFVFSFIQYFA